MTTISVIIPCYNASKTIGRALHSVLNQTYPDFEIVIVDDGSADDSVTVVEQFISKSPTANIRLFQQENQGPSVARNRAVHESFGEFIAFLDADDEWHPDKLRIQLEQCENENLNFVGAKFQYDEFSDGTISDYSVKKVSFKKLLYYNCFPTPGVMMSKKLFVEVGGFDESLGLAEDFDLWLKCALREELLQISHPSLVRLHKFSFGSGGLSANMSDMFKHEKKVYENFYSRGDIKLGRYKWVLLILRIKFQLRKLVVFLKKTH